MMSCIALTIQIDGKDTKCTAVTLLDCRLNGTIAAVAYHSSICRNFCTFRVNQRIFLFRLAARVNPPSSAASNHAMLCLNLGTPAIRPPAVAAR